MPAFSYKAVDAAGKASKGVLEAANAGAARAALRGRNLLPMSVEMTDRPVGEAKGGIDLSQLFRQRVGARALSTVTRQVSTLVSSDIRIEEALRLVAAQADTPAMAGLLLNVRGGILDGRSFAQALGDHPAAFPEFYRASVAAGEQSGRLPEVLNHLAEFVEHRHRNQQKVQLALLYPALLAVVSIGMMVLLLVYVVPDIVKVFVSRGAELPLLTRALIALSAGFQSYGLVMAAAIAAAVFGWRAWVSRAGNRLRFHRRLATTRPVAGFSRKHNAARFAGSLATLVQSMVPLVEALNAAAAVTPNLHVRERARAVAARVREGASLQTAMTEAAIFPSMLVAIVASGESSGRLGPALGRAAGELDRELEQAVSTLVALVEPAVLLMMGGLVLLMVLAILLPIINLNDLVGA